MSGTESSSKPHTVRDVNKSLRAMALTSALNYRSKIDIYIFKIAPEFDSLLSNIDCGNVLFGLVDHDEHTGLF